VTLPAATGGGGGAAGGGGEKGVSKLSRVGWKKKVAANRFAAFNSSSDDTTRCNGALIFPVYFHKH
jgi:hypothetical protein